MTACDVISTKWIFISKYINTKREFHTKKTVTLRDTHSIWQTQTVEASKWLWLNFRMQFYMDWGLSILSLISYSAVMFWLAKVVTKNFRSIYDMAVLYFNRLENIWNYSLNVGNFTSVYVYIADAFSSFSGFFLTAVISTNWMCSVKQTEALFEIKHSWNLWLIRLLGWNNKVNDIKAYAIIKSLTLKVCPLC